MKALAILALTLIATAQQRNAGELRILLLDSTGAPIQADAILTSQTADLRRHFTTGPDGRHILRILPFGIYNLQASKPGLQPQETTIHITSEHPQDLTLTLPPAPIRPAVIIRDTAALVDPTRTGAAQHIGRDTIDHRRSSTPGRDVLDLINLEPGWLLEANGILHPRGSEYQVQYVIDGIPITDNRSPAFAQSLGVEEFESMNIRTGNYPAEYGRKLGGVIEVSTERDRRQGLHGRAVLQAGSFHTRSGYASLQYATNRTTIGISGEGMQTNRYLDAPVEENYTNHASGGGIAARFDLDATDNNRTRAYIVRRRTGYQVPNELLQQQAGQRQDRTAEETMGHISHQHVFSPTLLGNLRLMARDTRAGLWSNPLSTPIAPFQNRGFRETYLNGSVSGTIGRHEWKTGAEAVFARVEEDFTYRITAYRLNPGNVRIFDREVPPTFHFAAANTNREQAAFLQDRWRHGNWTLSAGLRYDRYNLIAEADAWSPRLAIAYHVAPAGL
ncbi:MAG TPA: TonB-dependent receptor, partial [Bryobacteraceae bacterium]|nr:TonB-dependent receptor [Bryobacteraceae bacterium]